MALHPYSAGGAYINMMMDEGEEQVRAAYRDNYARLAQIKAKYDPDQSVPREPEHRARSIGCIGARPALCSASVATGRKQNNAGERICSPALSHWVSALPLASAPASAGAGRPGSHQFQRPNRRIVAGTSSVRMIAASTSTATVIPRPDLLRR